MGADAPVRAWRRKMVAAPDWSLARSTSSATVACGGRVAQKTTASATSSG